MNKYLVKIYWLKRKMERYTVDANNECQALMRSVELGKKTKNEPYDHHKSSAQFVFKHEVKL